MCTVSYVPTSNGYILTSNRDENPQRGTVKPPQKYDFNGKSVFMPLDIVSNGTWFLTCENSFTVCLLNGAKANHIKAEKYRHSRGRIAIDFCKYNDLEDFIKKYDFNEIEPFTILVIETSNKLNFNTIRWDGKVLERTINDASKPLIFSSATLYSPEIMKKREDWFFQYLEENNEISQESLVNFHTTTQTENKINGLIIDRSEILKTVSVTSIDYNSNRTMLNYIDLNKKTNFNYRIIHGEICHLLNLNLL